MNSDVNEVVVSDTTEQVVNPIIEIFKGENGPVYAGMIGIVLVAAIGMLSHGKYKVSLSSLENCLEIAPS